MGLDSSSILALERPVVSVAVITLNSGPTLRQCLSSLRGLRYPAHLLDLFLVDAGSTDETLQIAREFDVTVYMEPGASRGRARNVCFQKAKGTIVAMVDADNITPSDWIEKALAFFTDTKIAAVRGPQLTPVFDKTSLLERLILLYARGPDHILLEASYAEPSEPPESVKYKQPDKDRHSARSK